MDADDDGGVGSEVLLGMMPAVREEVDGLPDDGGAERGRGARRRWRGRWGWMDITDAWILHEGRVTRGKILGKFFWNFFR
jgi:hypothetical protein